MIGIHLRCESLCDPIGIDAARPRFSWVIDDERRGAAQSAWQIEVRDALDGGLLWDSGRIADTRQHHLAYAGEALRSFQDCRWRVKLWNEADEAGDWSMEARFVCGFLGEDSFTADWLHYPVNMLPDATFFRRDFSITKPVARAFLALTARGIVEPWLDGQRVGDEYFLPGWTEYTKRINYHVFDCSDICTVGEHRLGAIVAEGWWRGQVGNHASGVYGEVCMLLAELHIVYEDGSRERIARGDDWQCRTSEYLRASLQHGEHCDARKRVPAWCSAVGDDAGWRQASRRAVSDGYFYRLQDRRWFEAPPLFSAHPGQAVRAVKELPAVRRHEAEAGSFIYDIAQNIAGVVRLKIAAPAGTVVRLRYGEMVNPDGSLYVENLRSAQATDVYVCAGGGEVYQPRFTFHGFRFVEVSGLPAPLPLAAVVAVVLASDTPEAGTFDCSNVMLNQLHENTRWTMRGNFIDVPTDCPQRDERLGWTGDAQVFAGTACGMADVEGFYRKWLRDLVDEQSEEGGVPNVVPGFGQGANADAAWGDVMTVLPTVVAERYGDPALLREWLPRMQAFCNYYAQRVGEDGCREGGHCFGDWLALDVEDGSNRSGGTPKPLIQTAFYVYSCRLTARAAETLAEVAIAEEMHRRADDCAAAFGRRFVAVDGRIDGDTQTGYVLALAFDLLPEARRADAVQRLAGKIEAAGRKLSTGFVGVSYLLPTLARFGLHDLAYSLLEEEGFPSWGYSIANGATTIWERWNGWLAGQGPGDPNMNSYSHYAYGSVCEFMHQWVCGLRPLEPGFRRALIAPQPGGTLRHASYEYESIVGRWRSAWRRAAAGCVYEMTVPAGARASCQLPLAGAAAVKENGEDVSSVAGVSKLMVTDDLISFDLAAGSYTFSVC